MVNDKKNYSSKCGPSPLKNKNLCSLMEADIWLKVEVAD